MEQQLELIREQQKETWNKFSSGWRKWDNFVMAFMKPMADEMIGSLNLKATDIVLDVAAGTGEPGLTIAAITNNGKVFIADLSEGMLEVAHENAAKKGITNYETVLCDVCELPFENETFDAISCRFGFMFFPDMLMAAKEMVRVLKPGGTISTAVWSTPDKNFWINSIMGTINKNMQLPAPPAGAPGMFRCGKTNFIADLFIQAGLKNVTEKEVNGKLDCGTKDNYWLFMNDVAAPVVGAMSKADEATKSKIKEELFELLDQKNVDGNLRLDFGTIIVCGEK